MATVLCVPLRATSLAGKAKKKLTTGLETGTLAPLG
jgi:hypothetical protein